MSVEDIRILVQGSKAKLGGLTLKGLEWLFKNMYTRFNEPVTIEKEHVQEIKDMITKDGLTVKESQ